MDSSHNDKQYKVRILAKGFTQNECIDYHETFYQMSKNDSFRMIMTLIAHLGLELHQMDVKTIFINWDLKEEGYMRQLEGFNDNNHKPYKFKKIYL